jgi:hypothetical protein
MKSIDSLDYGYALLTKSFFDVGSEYLEVDEHIYYFLVVSHNVFSIWRVDEGG